MVVMSTSNWHKQGAHIRREGGGGEGVNQSVKGASRVFKTAFLAFKYNFFANVTPSVSTLSKAEK